METAKPQISQIAQIEKRDPLTYAVIGAAMEVHRSLGRGFLEAVYQDALESEFIDRKIPFAREVEIPVHYKGKELRTHYRPDFVCFDSVIVELKAIARVTEVEEAQVLNYLKASHYEVGLLLNFRTQSLGYRRFAFSKSV